MLGLPLEDGEGRGDVSGIAETERAPLPLLPHLGFTSGVYVVGIILLIYRGGNEGLKRPSSLPRWHMARL